MENGQTNGGMDADCLDAEAAGLVRALSGLPGVRGILLGGSRATGRAEALSDYDIYVYADEEIPAAARRAAIAGFYSRLELDNRFWETEDDGVLLSGIPVDIVYRSLSWTRGALEAKLERHQADTGYSTCIWDNVLRSRVLFDPAGEMAALKSFADRPYPAELAHSIVAKNLPLLKSGIPAYHWQIEKAIARGDLVSVNHRLAAYLASWFDILFALNNVPHPGEKRLVALASELCPDAPPGWGEDLEAALSLAALGSPALLGRLDRLSSGLEELAARKA